MSAKVSYERWAATASEGQCEINTVEYEHPDWPDSYRFVQGFASLTATDESSIEKQFQPISFIYESAGMRADGDTATSCNFGAAVKQLEDAYSRITTENRTSPVRQTFRRYYSGDTSSPVFVERTDIKSIVFNGFTGAALAGEDTDFNNKPSGVLYRLREYPLLKGLR